MVNHSEITIPADVDQWVREQSTAQPMREPNVFSAKEFTERYKMSDERAGKMLQAGVDAGRWERGMIRKPNAWGVVRSTPGYRMKETDGRKARKG